MRLVVTAVYHLKNLDKYCVTGTVDGVIRIGTTMSTEDGKLTICCSGVAIIERQVRLSDEVDITIDEPDFPFGNLVGAILIGEL